MNASAHNNEGTWDKGGNNCGTATSADTHKKLKAQVFRRARGEFPKPSFSPAHHLLSGDVGIVN